MNKLVIAVAAVSSALIPVAQAADYTYQSGDPKESSSWKDATGETPEGVPGETDGVVFGAAGTEDTFPVKSDLIYSKFTAKNEIGDTTIDLTSDSAAVTNTLTIGTGFIVENGNLTIKNGGLNMTNTADKIKYGIAVLPETSWVVLTNVHFEGCSLMNSDYKPLKNPGKGSWLVQNDSFIHNTATTSFDGKELIFEGCNTVCTNDNNASFQMRGSFQKLIVRDGARLRFHTNTQLSLGGHKGGLYNVSNEFHVVNGARIEGMKEILANGNPAILCISNTTTHLPKLSSFGTNSLVRICDAVIENELKSAFDATENTSFILDNATMKFGANWTFGTNAVFELKNGATIPAGLVVKLNGENSALKVTGGSSVSFSAGFKGNFELNSTSASVIIDDSAVTNSYDCVHTKGTIVLSGANPKLYQKENKDEDDYVCGNDTATVIAEYPTLKFILPGAENDVWTEAPFYVDGTAKFGTNAKLVVEVPKTLKKKMSVPLLTAKNGLSLGEGVLAIADLPEGATLAVGNYDETTKKWVAAENGKTLFINLPSRVGFVLSLK